MKAILKVVAPPIITSSVDFARWYKSLFNYGTKRISNKAVSEYYTSTGLGDYTDALDNVRRVYYTYNYERWLDDSGKIKSISRTLTAKYPATNVITIDYDITNNTCIVRGKEIPVQECQEMFLNMIELTDPLPVKF